MSWSPFSATHTYVTGFSRSPAEQFREDYLQKYSKYLRNIKVIETVCTIAGVIYSVEMLVLNTGVQDDSDTSTHWYK